MVLKYKNIHNVMKIRIKFTRKDEPCKKWHVFVLHDIVALIHHNQYLQNALLPLYKKKYYFHLCSQKITLI